MPTRTSIGAAAIVTLLGAGGALGNDLRVADIEPIPNTVYELREQVQTRQKGNVVEVEMPWKGLKGLTVKYDLGEPTATERLKDKRDKKVAIQPVDYQGGDGIKFDLILEKKPKTNVFCQQIEGWEDYNFYRQPPLNEEYPDAKNCSATECDTDGDGEIDVSRPLEIVNGYAIYHKEKRDHIVGQENYETGKFGDVPYPEIWELEDESTKHRAESFDITDGEMCVTVSEDWLKKAKYPVRIDPTFGYTSIGASDWAYAGSYFDYERIYGQKTTSITGTLDSVTMAAKASSAGAQTGAVGVSSALTSIGNILYDTAWGLTLTTSYDWYTYTASDETITADDLYVGVKCGNAFSSPPTLAYDTGGTNGVWYDNKDSSEWESHYDFSVYATYTASASPFTPKVIFY